MLRSIIFASHHMMNRAMSGAEAPEEIRSGSQEVFAGFTNGRGASGYPYRIGEVPSPFKFAGIVPNYIREPELPEGNLVVLTGNSESGKSSLAYAWARDANIAHGIPFLALDRDNPVNVVANRLARLHIDDGLNSKSWADG